MSRQRVALRWAALAVIVHAAIVSLASIVYCLLVGRQASLAAQALLRIVDWPVLWAIERAFNGAAAMFLADGYRLPASWPLDAIWTTVLFLSFLHTVIGGALYGLLAAFIFLVLDRRRRHPAEPRALARG